MSSPKISADSAMFRRTALASKKRKEKRFVLLIVRNLLGVPAALLAYAFTLHWTYQSIIQPAFAYAGQRYVPAPLPFVLLTFMIAVATAWMLPQRLTRPSSAVLWVLYAVTIAPTILMSTYGGVLEFQDAVLMSLGFAAAFGVVCLGVRARPVRRPLFPRPTSTTFWIVVVAFSVLVYGYLAAEAGLSLRFLSIFDVYDVREDYADALSSAGLLGYLVSTQANVVNPLIMARGLMSRRWALVAVGVLGQLVIYSGTGFKTVLFSVPALVIVALMFRANLRPRALNFIWGSSGLILVAAALDVQSDGIVWSSLFARRFLITPARLSQQYLSFYGDGPYEMLSHSVLAPFFPNPPYPRGPARMIGYWVSGSPELSANANLFADGYAHFGWFGVFGAGIVLLVFLRILDRAAHGLPTVISSLVVVMPAVALSNTSILTSMLSHGLLAMVILLALAPRRGWGPGASPSASGESQQTSPVGRPFPAARRNTSAVAERAAGVATRAVRPQSRSRES
ncbi:hypothetical protein [Microbacterium sp. LWH12-1.2]|uniref:hypothetical protein n=1 Tax=Microbacterium sp. LWH12-1.2 TaxID=3135259 RepID=UPI00341BD49F